MREISVLVVVDVEGALSNELTGGLANNVYLVDTNKHIGSGDAGQAELSTVCQDGQMILWSVATLAPDTEIEITGFTGGAVSSRIINPKEVTSVGGTYWWTTVEAGDVTGSQQYSIDMMAERVKMSFDPFLIIQPAS